MATIRNFEDLTCWKKSREITSHVYRITKNTEFSADYPLIKQIRRSAVSVMSNIAEGFERDGNKEFIHFLSIAKGSAGEVRAQLYVAKDQQYLTEAEFRFLLGLVIENSKVISGLIQYLKHSGIKGRKFR